MTEETNGVTIDKAFVLDELRKFIQPYYAYDRTGRCIEAVSDIAFDIYSTDLAAVSGRNQEDVLSPKLIRSAARQALNFNMAAEDPSVNGFPVMPFKPNMTPQAMREIWGLVTEEDLTSMNGGFHPVDSMDKREAQPIDFERIKGGWLVYVEPGKYNIGVPDTEDPNTMVYAVNPKTKLCYVFDYNAMAKELEKRRI
jgi:hypothetical protein